MKVIIATVIIALLPVLIELSLRRRFLVHETGVVVISGCSSGIGLDAAMHLAKLGYTVFAGVRTQNDADLLKSAFNSPHLIPTIFDVTKPEQLESLVTSVEEYLSQSKLALAAVINNAGIGHRAPFESTDLKDARRVYDVNLFGAMDLTQHFIPLLRHHKGRVIFVSSIAGLASIAGSSIYASSKRAIEGFIDSLRLEMAWFDVPVISVLPGYITTKIVNHNEDNSQLVGPDQYELYKGFWINDNNKMRKVLSKAANPDVASQVIIEALTSPYPLVRYPVGPVDGILSAKVIASIVGILPDRVADRLKFTSNHVPNQEGGSR